MNDVDGGVDTSNAIKGDLSDVFETIWKNEKLRENAFKGMFEIRFKANAKTFFEQSIKDKYNTLVFQYVFLDKEISFVKCKKRE